jgi:transcriptional regulator with XRE-family HTH domain
MRDQNKSVKKSEARKNFSFNIKLLRQARDISGEELSHAVGLKRNRIHYLESGYGLIGLDDIFPLLAYFEISFEQLFNQKIRLNINKKAKEVA